MFKNLLNNPWFVAAFGVFAFGYLAYVVAVPIFFDDNPAEYAAEQDYPYDQDMDGLDDPELDTDDFNTGSSSALASIELQRREIRWLNDVDRDPFAGTSLASDAQSYTQLPRVGALFVSSAVQAAVVNNRLVRVGDTVDQYQVSVIGPNHVEVIQAGKSIRLEPEV